jgi:hypothetical protein
MPSLPDNWSAGRSSAALIALASTYTSPSLSELQLDLMRWELEKYGPAFHEPFADVAINEALQVTHGERDVRAAAIAHGSEILRRRGREMLDGALCAAARVAVFGTPNPALDALFYDVSRYAHGKVAMGDGNGEVQLGDDEMRDMEMDMKLPRRPNAAELAHQLRVVVPLVDRPAGWTSAHALGFLIHAGHVVDRANPGPVPEIASKMLASFAQAASCSAAPSELLRAGEMLYTRCEANRFIVMRAVDDQLMHFVSFQDDVRQLIVRFVNEFASPELTPWRRAMITATMAVLATSPKAMQRERHCGAWPRLR